MCIQSKAITFDVSAYVIFQNKKTKTNKYPKNLKVTKKPLIYDRLLRDPDAMESCLGVEREVSRVQDKITSVRNAQRKTLDEVIDAVQKAKQELQNGEKL